jgi:DNA-binding transcriptional LysR family regulator
VKRVLLRKENLVVAAHSSHPLAQRVEGVHLADLVDEKLLFIQIPQNQIFRPSL